MVPYTCIAMATAIIWCPKNPLKTNGSQMEAKISFFTDAPKTCSAVLVSGSELVKSRLAPRRKHNVTWRSKESKENRSRTICIVQKLGTYP